MKTFLRFFRMRGEERSGKLKFVCSDMWKPYLKVIAKKAGQAIHVLDRFHIMQKMPFNQWKRERSTKSELVRQGR